eukprot:CAMPEP_0184717508 /NCGR_PEP_ID=MMETSP0314-20130426/6960_1 /TAXON_ID=38298 /ORGANISM="Rhodella maculata, Strain CCMP 736" /LENGTH=39 /DNA_ID= /DNA_START= /DNA_END= /DNA_ORIENTATION=
MTSHVARGRRVFNPRSPQQTPGAIPTIGTTPSGNEIDFI